MAVILFAWASIAAFLSLVVSKLLQYHKKPINLRWDLYPVPQLDSQKGGCGGSYMEELDWASRPPQRSKLAELAEISREVLYLKRLKDHNRYGLWLWSFSMHWGIYLLLGWIVLLFLSHSFPALVIFTPAIGTIAILLGLVGTLGLLFKRAAQRDLAKYSTPADYFNLVFLLVIFAFGLGSLLDGSGLAGQQIYISNMLDFDPDPVPLAASAMFITLQLFAIYMPFSKLIHYLMKHFTFSEILWDDSYKTKGSHLDQKIAEQLKLRPNWKAAHFKGAASWIEEVVFKPFQDGQ